MWRGSAAVCLNDKRELLMVKQGKPEEEKGRSFGIDCLVHYFHVVCSGGEMKIQDPDELIYEIR